MSVRLLSRLTCAALFVARAAGAQEESFWSFLRTDRPVSRCAPQTPALEGATARLKGLDERINRLGDAESPDPLIKDLHALLKSDCFRLAAEARRVPRPDTALALKAWWSDGGLDWLDTYLELPKLGTLPDLLPHVAVPPDTRATLDPDHHRNHPLTALLCPLRDSTCGAATRGWKQRADAHFAAHRQLAERDDTDAQGTPRSSEPTVVATECASAIPATAGAERYRRWRDCIENRR